MTMLRLWSWTGGNLPDAATALTVARNATHDFT
jgi:hypothetical protein